VVVLVLVVMKCTNLFHTNDKHSCTQDNAAAKVVAKAKAKEDHKRKKQEEKDAALAAERLAYQKLDTLTSTAKWRFPGPRPPGIDMGTRKHGNHNIATTTTTCRH
jgi:dTDP-4-dehydrorhamnose reductase